MPLFLHLQKGRFSHGAAHISLHLGRGMNAAFAIGRLCDMDNGRKRLLQLSESERMVKSVLYF